MKEVYVILAFHAHEPLWDLPHVLLEGIDDEELKQTLPSENWIVRRKDEGRDIYRALLNFARSMNITVTLEATNELLVQVAEVMPETYTELKKAYRDRTIYPLYGHAHHTHVALLNEKELEDEIRLNREYLHDVMGVPEPGYHGLFPTEDSLDSSKLRGIKNSGIDFVIFPNLDRHKARYRKSAAFDEKHQPFLIGSGIIALPRHFAVSQYIWRPITKWKAEGVKNQGYILGRYWVLPEEYRRHRFVRFPIDREEAIEEYHRTLHHALTEAPDRGLILYIQDLELMDFGDVAMDIMEESWKRVIKEDVAKVKFVTPDDYLAKVVIPEFSHLNRIYFHQVSWAPEIRLVLRYDGHYPPLEAGKFRGVNTTRDIFRRWPFIFWEPGRYLAQLVDSLLDTFNLDEKVGVTAKKLQEIDYRFEELGYYDQVALHARIIKRACNWGWFPNEGLQKRPFLHGYVIANLLLKRLGEKSPQLMPFILPVACFQGLERLPEVILDTRYNYLHEALSDLKAGSDRDYSAAFGELNKAMQWRKVAYDSVVKAHLYTRRKLSLNDTGIPRQEMIELLTDLRDYCRAVFLSLDHLQRVWGQSGNIDYLLLKMYEYLFELYPPLFPSILESTLTDAEIQAVNHPHLR